MVGEAVKAKPLAKELRGEAAGLWITEHALRLTGELLGFAQFTGGGGAGEFRVRHGRPEEVAQAAGKFRIGKRSNATPVRGDGQGHARAGVSPSRAFYAIEKRWSHEDTRKKGSNGFSMIELRFVSQARVERAQATFLGVTQRSAPGEPGETKSVLDVPRFSRLECLLRRSVLLGQSIHKSPRLVRRLIDPFLPQLPNAPAFFPPQLEFLDDETEESVVVIKGG